jgi:hypothetical protein
MSASRWHHILECVNDGLVWIQEDINSSAPWDEIDGYDYNRLANLIHSYADAPHFVFDTELFAILTREGADDSIDDFMRQYDTFKAMNQAGLCHLPMPQMTIEFYWRNGWVVVMVEEDEANSVFWATAVTLQKFKRKEYAEKMGSEYFVNVYPFAAKVDANMFSVTNEEDGDKGFTIEAVALSGIPQKWFSELPDQQTLLQRCSGLLTIAVVGSITLLHTRGINKKYVEAPHKLNKKRSEKGRLPIRPYTYVHIEHVYDRKGVAHTYNAKNRTMPMHLRRAHWRGVRYGAKKVLIRERFFPAVIVNYDPTLTLEHKEYRVKR